MKPHGKDAHVTLAADEAHGSGGLDEFGIINVMARFFTEDHRFDVFDNLRARGAIANDIAQRMFDCGKQAGANLAVSCQPDAGTGATERLRYRSNYANFAGRAVGKSIANRGFGSATDL